MERMSFFFYVTFFPNMWKCSRFLICEILDFFCATGNRPIVKVLVNYSKRRLLDLIIRILGRRGKEKAINSSAQNRGGGLLAYTFDINIYTIPLYVCIRERRFGEIGSTGNSWVYIYRKKFLLNDCN
jgi:hypothetical protein